RCRHDEPPRKLDRRGGTPYLVSIRSDACGQGRVNKSAPLSLTRLDFVVRASSVICALSTLDTGQVFSALPASSLNFASSTFGTLARSVSVERLMRNPWPSGSRLTAASVVN